MRIAALIVVAVPLAGCVSNTAATPNGVRPLTVSSTNDTCSVSESTVRSGPVSFAVANNGDRVTEFYILAQDGLRIIGEVENIGPGITRDLTIHAKPGSYVTLCKPGMVGDGVGKASFTVTESGTAVEKSETEQQQIDAAANGYVAYVKDQVGRLVSATQEFVTAYTAGDDATARALYGRARSHYERIEPVAESFGDLDPKIDLREADVAPGDEWTGWHLLEKDLWPPAAEANAGVAYLPLTEQQRASDAATLVADTQKLYDLVHKDGFSLTIDAISNGAVSLLDEVASKKITGEEEMWSHTDLWDMSANLDGARVAYDGVRDIAIAKDSNLASRLDTQFSALQQRLSAFGNVADGFVLYNTLSPAQIKDLANSVNALGEPLSKLTAALVS